MALFNVALDVADESKSYFQTGDSGLLVAHCWVASLRANAKWNRPREHGFRKDSFSLRVVFFGQTWVNSPQTTWFHASESCYFPLLVLKGIHHCWKVCYFFPGGGKANGRCLRHPQIAFRVCFPFTLTGLLKRYMLQPFGTWLLQHQNKGKPSLTRQCSGV